MTEQHGKNNNNNNNNNGNMKQRPSDKRREMLRRADSINQNSLTLSNLCPIERYYAASDKVLASFKLAYNEGRLDDAYVYGKRFATFSSFALPTHDYYKSTKQQLKDRRTKNIRDLSFVTVELEKIATLMDREEMEKAERIEAERARLAKEDILRRRRELENNRKQSTTTTKENDMMGGLSIDEKLSKLTKFFPKSSSKSTKKPKMNKQRIKTHPLATDKGTTTDDDKKSETKNNTLDFDDASMNHLSSATSLPPLDDLTVLQPPTHLPHHEGSADGGTADLLNLAEFSDPLAAFRPPAPLAPPPSSSSPSPSKPDTNDQQKKKPPSQPTMPLSSFQRLCTQEFLHAQSIKNIQIYPLSTYQGKLTNPSNDSTNGCTVIAPLVAMAHLQSPNPGISDAQIEDVINETAPPILFEVRRTLGLRSDALIVPSDVHNYLFDKGVLSEDKFVGVSGGNILDEEHIKSFLKMLECGSADADAERSPHTRKKVAVALFFHEHVFSILKMILPGDEAWYDVVDSMPRKTGVPAATRMRCKDIRSLETTLKWYACEKFTSANCEYIDGHEWDDSFCDFDPRVFQAFVWIE